MMLMLVLYNTLLLIAVAGAKTRGCDEAVGVSDGKLLNGQVTASAVENDVYVIPVLKQTQGGRAWCLNTSLDGRKYLEIDLGQVHRISAVYFQRTLGRSKTNTSRYLLMFKANNDTSWKYYHVALGGERPKSFTMDLGFSQVKRHELSGPHAMRYVRVIDVEAVGDLWCLQVELYGCPWKEGESLVQYKILQGQTRGGRISEAVKFEDDTYDGRIYNSGRRQPLLTDGLGQLTDGVLGADGFWDELGNGPGFEWVGWYDKVTPNPFITFQYDSEREFHQVRFHVNNQYWNVKLFGKVDVSFSQMGDYYYHKFYYKPTKAHKRMVVKAFFVEVDLQKQRGHFVNFQFHYSGKWILFSEIEIDSVPVTNSTRDHPPPKDIDDLSDDDEDDDLDLMESASPDHRESHSYVGLIAGIVSGIAVIAVIVILLIIRKRRQTNNESSTVQVHNRIPVQLANLNDEKASKVNNAQLLKVNLEPEEKAKKGEEIYKPNNTDYKAKLTDASDTWEKKDLSACRKSNTIVSINPNLLYDSDVEKV